MKIPKWLHPSLLLYALVMVCDWLSSYACWIAGTGHESNPFARNVALNFVWHKAVIVDSFFFIAYASVAWAAYHALLQWKKEWARAGVCGWFAYIAGERLISAVIPNILLALHFYVADPNAGISFILGNGISR